MHIYIYRCVCVKYDQTLDEHEYSQTSPSFAHGYSATLRHGQCNKGISKCEESRWYMMLGASNLHSACHLDVRASHVTSPQLN